MSSAFRWIVKWCFKILLITVLLLFGRASLALWVWGRGRLNRWIARQFDADPGMTQRQRWKDTRKIIYARNRRENGGQYRCEETGVLITDLRKAHVDHILSRAGFPLLAYEIKNLRLVTETVNIKKSDNLSVLAFLWFFLTGWNKQSVFVTGLVATFGGLWWINII